MDVKGQVPGFTGSDQTTSSTVLLMVFEGQGSHPTSKVWQISPRLASAASISGVSPSALGSAEQVQRSCASAEGGRWIGFPDGSWMGVLGDGRTEAKWIQPP